MYYGNDSWPAAQFFLRSTPEEKCVRIVLEGGQVEFEWHWYEDYKSPVPKPKFFPDIELGQIVAFSAHTKRYDFSGHSGSMNISTWLDVAANEAGR